MAGDEFLEFCEHRPPKHPKCKGRVLHYFEGTEFECDYDTTLTCDDCKYGMGRKDPEARCNQGRNL